MKYTHKAFVRWDDLDAFGHVNNAKYLTYAQEARFDWGWYSFAEKKEEPILMEMVVARAEVDYLAPITEGGCFYDVTLWVDSIGTSSFGIPLTPEMIADRERVAREYSIYNK